METIEDTKKNKSLKSALAKAQGQLKAAKKSQDNPFFKSKFADLAECLEVIQEPASKNGLSLLFNFKTEMIGENPATYIQYILSHESGEQITSDWLLMFMKDKTPQGFGASCTYYKRQLIKAIYQIPEVDDDGNTASGQVAQAAPKMMPPPQVPQQPQAKPINYAQNIKPRG